jgi:hypothetical protein
VHGGAGLIDRVTRLGELPSIVRLFVYGKLFGNKLKSPSFELLFFSQKSYLLDLTNYVLGYNLGYNFSHKKSGHTDQSARHCRHHGGL